MMDADRVNILVVDDLPEKILVVESILEELGQNVISACSGQDALRKVLDHDFAVILLDVNMPGMDGYETAGMIRKRKKSAHTPIIFITAYVDEVQTMQGYALGAVDYLLAPIVPAILRSKVSVFVDLFQMTQRVRRQAEERIELAAEQAARSAAEQSVVRLKFLAEASTILAGSLDFDGTLQALLRLAVPAQADLGVLALVDEAKCLARTMIAATEAPQGVTIRELHAEKGLPPVLFTALQRALHRGKAERLADVPVEKHTLKSLLVVPLLARGHTLGVLALGRRSTSPPLDVADQTLLEDLASRAAIALDNARLYRDIHEADRRKNEFLSMLAHELRNPLAPISNGIQILRMRSSDAPELRQLHEMIERQVHHLVRMVDDLLDISRITRGKIRIKLEPVTVAGVVSRALEASRPLIEARRHTLKVTQPSESLKVNADAVRLAQVLTNLFNNAAKYTPEGGQIWLTVERCDAQAVFRIRDNGLGIPGDMLASIFDLFTQVEQTLDRAHGGLGIGLTLVRQLIDLHGGTVEAFSAGVNQGSEFVVRLPLLTSGPVIVKAADTKPTTNKGRGRRILVVDDNADAVDSLTMLLQLAGHEVRIANDGHEALRAAEAFIPDVAVLDIGLPGMDGYEVARRLRQKWGRNHLFLVALSGYGRDQDLQSSQEAGFDKHLIKPADFDELSALIAAQSGASRG